MEAAEVADAADDEEDEEREEGARRHDSGHQDSIAPIRRSAERSIGQRQFQTTTAPLRSPTG